MNKHTIYMIAILHDILLKLKTDVKKNNYMFQQKFRKFLILADTKDINISKRE